MSNDLTFSLEEYGVRLTKVQAIMAAHQLDFVILDEPEMMAWLTGYTVSENLWRACIVPALGEPYLLLRKLDIHPARQRSWIGEIVGFADFEDPIEVLADRLRADIQDNATIGVDFQSNSFTLHRHQGLSRLLPEVKIVDLERTAWDLRRNKSIEEIAHLKRAGSLLDKAFDETLSAVRHGARQRDIAAVAAASYYRLGFDDGFVGPLNAGSGWDSLHGFPADRNLVSGDVVHIELLPRLRYYTVRIMRSVVVGKATEAQKDAAAILIELQDRQIAALVPGANAADVDVIVRDGLIKSGLRDSYDNITGYTLGVAPLVSQKTSDLFRSFTQKADWEIEAGMVFHMYTSAAGISMSESVLVTEQGAERLTSTVRQIFETEAM